MTDPRSRVGTKVADENRTMLGELIWAAGARLLYEYDFGDGWQHELLLEEVLFGEESFQQICVAGERCCPPEVSHFEIASDKRISRHLSRSEHLGPAERRFRLCG